tara:strand:- start:98 stop:505 length:408 start_codon:yes stop_codon:yes gene_type:complete
MLRRFFSTSYKFPIYITNNAWKKMDSILKKQDAYTFLFSAKSGGCNGFNYDLSLLNLDEYFDYIERINNPSMIELRNTRLLIEPTSEILLFGTTIDYIEENFNKGIFENKFTFTPDKDVALGCGCGVSFTPKIKL